MPSIWKPPGYTQLGSSNAHRKTLDVEDIVRRYLAGESENSIAKSLNVGRFAIRRRLLDSDIEVRNGSEAERVKRSTWTDERRMQQVNAAHAAVRGRVVSFEERSRTATTRQERALGRSPYEDTFESWLRVRGITSISQLAVGKYNIDLAIPPIAVEIFGGRWHTAKVHRIKHSERFPYLINNGWHLYIVWIDKRREYRPTIADDFVSFMKEVRRSPSTECQYRVIWGNGDLISAGSAESDDISFIYPPSGRRYRNALGQYASY